MDKVKFKDSGICDTKIDEIISVSKEENGKIAYRRIKHSRDLPLSDNDFFPSIMEKNGGKMPIEQKQINKNVKNFGMSVFDNYEKFIDVITFTPTLNSEGYSNASGHVDGLKGVVGCHEACGHYQYFLFDPTGNNPKFDFDYIE